MLIRTNKIWNKIARPKTENVMNEEHTLAHTGRHNPHFEWHNTHFDRSLLWLLNISWRLSCLRLVWPALCMFHYYYWLLLLLSLSLLFDRIRRVQWTAEFNEIVDAITHTCGRVDSGHTLHSMRRRRRTIPHTPHNCFSKQQKRRKTMQKQCEQSGDIFGRTHVERWSQTLL